MCPTPRLMMTSTTLTTTFSSCSLTSTLRQPCSPASLKLMFSTWPLDADSPWTFSRFHSNFALHLISSHHLLIPKSNPTLQTAICVVRPCGYTVTIADTLCSSTPALSALKGYSLTPQHNCSTGSVLLLAAALVDPLLTQLGLVLSQASALYSTSLARLT